MLDRSGANARILFRWLGGMVAEPVWEDDIAGFYVRDDQGGRLEDVICQPASAQDLQGLLRDDLGKLRQRLEQLAGRNAHRTHAPQSPPADLRGPGRQPGPQRPRQLLLPLPRRDGQLAADLVLGLRAAGPRTGPLGRMHRSELQSALRPPPRQEPPLPQLCGNAPGPAQEQDQLEDCRPGPLAAAVAARWNRLVDDAARRTGRLPGPVRPARSARGSIARSSKRASSKRRTSRATPWASPSTRGWPASTRPPARSASRTWAIP